MCLMSQSQMSQSQILRKQIIHFSLFTFPFLPVRLVGLLNPVVAIPAGDDFPETSLATEASLQSTKIVHRERWCQLVEDRVIAAISGAFVTSIHKLTLQCLAKGFHLLVQTILSHHHREVQTCLRLLSTTRQHMEDDPTAEADDRRTLAIRIAPHPRPNAS